MGELSTTPNERMRDKKGEALVSFHKCNPSAHEKRPEKGTGSMVTGEELSNKGNEAFLRRGEAQKEGGYFMRTFVRGREEDVPILERLEGEKESAKI